MKKLILSLMAILVFFNANAEEKNMSNEILTVKQKNLVYISSLMAKSEIDNLKVAVNNALDTGLTVNEIKDLMVQLYAYCGFPKALNALAALDAVVKERKEQGKEVVEGKKATPLPKDTDILALGTEVQTKLVGSPVSIKLSDDIDKYLKSHLFGDIFASDIFDWQEREVITIAALGSIKGVEPQFEAHKNIGKVNGLTDEQIAEIEKLIK